MFSGKGSIEKVLDALYYDNLVRIDKVGTSKFYWAFESTSIVSKQNEIEKLDNEIERAQKEIEIKKKQISNAEKLRCDEDREPKIQELVSIEEEIESIKQELKKYEDCDPQLIENLENGINVASEAQERWTDLIFSIAKLVKEKKGMSNSEFFKYFHLPADLDYIEDNDTIDV